MFSIIIPLIRSNLRWIIPFIGITILCLSAWHYVEVMKKTAYDNGVKDERARYEQIIAAEESKNRRFEGQLNKAISQFGQKAISAAADRVKKETVHTHTVETVIRDNPIYKDCKADKEVIDNRNAIRSFGPTQ